MCVCVKGELRGERRKERGREKEGREREREREREGGKGDAHYVPLADTSNGA